MHWRRRRENSSTSADRRVSQWSRKGGKGGRRQARERRRTRGCSKARSDNGRNRETGLTKRRKEDNGKTRRGRLEDHAFPSSNWGREKRPGSTRTGRRTRRPACKQTGERAWRRREKGKKRTERSQDEAELREGVEQDVLAVAKRFSRLLARSQVNAWPLYIRVSQIIYYNNKVLISITNNDNNIHIIIITLL